MLISQLMMCTNIVLLVSTLLLLIVCLFFLIECIAALLPNDKSPNADNCPDGITILVPAHNEEVVIASTLEKLTPALKKQDRLVVIADNCSDATAQIARAKGAIVIERHDPNHKGKGYALDYGLQYIESDPPNVVVFVDADCTVAPNAIETLTQCAYATGRPCPSYLSNGKTEKL